MVIFDPQKTSDTVQGVRFSGKPGNFANCKMLEKCGEFFG